MKTQFMFDSILCEAPASFKGKPFMATYTAVFSCQNDKWGITCQRNLRCHGRALAGITSDIDFVLWCYCFVFWLYYQFCCRGMHDLFLSYSSELLHWCWCNLFLDCKITHGIQLLSHRASNWKISQSIQAAWLNVIMIESFWNLKGTFETVLSKCVSNFSTVRE